MGSQAFPGKRLNGFFAPPEDLVLIGLDTEDGPDHPLYDPRVHGDPSEELAKDLIVNGVLQPVRVLKNGDAAEVVFGRQRVKAARLANAWLKKRKQPLIQVPFMLYRAPDEITALGVTVSENEHRRGDDVIVKAGKAQRLLDGGMKKKEVAIRFGVGEGTIGNWLSLLDTSSKVQKAVLAGKVSATAATKLSSLPKGEQNAALAEMLDTGKTTARDAGTQTSGRSSGGTRPTTDPTKPKVSLIRRVWSEGTLLTPEERQALGWVLGTEEPSKVVRDMLEKFDD